MMYNLEIALAPAGQARLIELAKRQGRSVENIAAQVLEDALRVLVDDTAAGQQRVGT